MEATLPMLIEMFTATKQTEGKSAKTISWYRSFLSRFAAWLGPTAKIRDFTLDKVRAFIVHLQSRETHRQGSLEVEGGVSPRTVHAYIRSLKAFSSWLFEDGFTPQNVLLKLKRPKLPETVIDILTEDEQRKILGSINPRCFLGARLYVCVLLLLDTGIRASELAQLTLENTHLTEGYIKVRGKGQKERMIPIGGTTKKAIFQYVNFVRPEPAHEKVNNLILTAGGYPITYEAVRHMIKRLAAKTGIERLHAHLFRHSFAVNYLMAGGDLMTLKMMLGHSRLDVTETYLHLAQKHVAIQHARFSQVDRLGITGKRKRAVV